MNIIELLQWLLALCGTAVLACWLAYQSTIIQKIKGVLRLTDKPINVKWKPWFKPFGFLLESLKELLNCPYCLSWWLGLFTNIFLFKITLPLSILYACLSIVFVELYRKISL